MMRSSSTRWTAGGGATWRVCSIPGAGPSTAGNCSESMGEHLMGVPPFLMPNQPEPLLPATALTARSTSCRTSQGNRILILDPTLQPQLLTPSFPPTRESRAPAPVILSATGNQGTPAPVIAMKIANFHTHKWPRQGHWQFSPQRESRALSVRQHGHGSAGSPGGRRPRAPRLPSAQPSLHTKRALDSRCGENDGRGRRGQVHRGWRGWRRNCSEAMGEHLIVGPSFLMPNQPEQ